jgi:hypothetical protein
VAVRSLGAVRQHHDKFSTERHPVVGKSKRRSWNTAGDLLGFQLRFLEGLVERSRANNARIQNEITLVSLQHRGCVSFQAHIKTGLQRGSTARQQDPGAHRRRRQKRGVGNESDRRGHNDLSAGYVCFCESTGNCGIRGLTNGLMQDAVWDELLFFQSQRRRWKFVVHCVPPLLGLLGPVNSYDCCDARRVVLVESMGKTIVHITVENQRRVVVLWK